MLTTLFLRDSLHVLVLKLGEVSSVLENLDERFLVERVLCSFIDVADGLNSGLEESLLVKDFSFDVGKLLFVFLGLSDTLLHGCILDSDSLAHLCLVNHDRFVRAKEVERDFIIAISLDRDVKSREDG